MKKLKHGVHIFPPQLPRNSEACNPWAAASAVVILMNAHAASIQAGIKKRDARHGVCATVNKVEIRKHQGGRVVKGYSYIISKIGTY